MANEQGSRRVGKSPRWSIHIDHPLSECVRRYGAPMRLYAWTPWGFLTIGEKSQVYDRAAKRWTHRYSYITLNPRETPR